MTPNFFVRRSNDIPYQRVGLHACDRDVDLTWKAVGLLTYLMTRPNGWEISIHDLVRRHREGSSAVRTAIDELERGGYVRRYRAQGPDGKIETTVWLVSDAPMDEALVRDLLREAEAATEYTLSLVGPYAD